MGLFEDNLFYVHDREGRLLQYNYHIELIKEIAEFLTDRFRRQRIEADHTITLRGKTHNAWRIAREAGHRADQKPGIELLDNGQLISRRNGIIKVIQARHITSLTPYLEPSVAVMWAAALGLSGRNDEGRALHKRLGIDPYAQRWTPWLAEKNDWDKLPPKERKRALRFLGRNR